jgi:hypothetical protein
VLTSSFAAIGYTPKPGAEFTEDDWPEAAGKRFLALADGPAMSFVEVADILRRRLGPLAARAHAGGAPGRVAVRTEGRIHPFMSSADGRTAGQISAGWPWSPGTPMVSRNSDPVRLIRLAIQRTAAYVCGPPMRRSQIDEYGRNIAKTHWGHEDYLKLPLAIRITAGQGLADRWF